jgi:hypothetical protein
MQFIIINVPWSTTMVKTGRAGVGWVRYRHGERNHQSIGNKLIAAVGSNVAVKGRGVRRQRLGGVLNQLLSRGCVKADRSLAHHEDCAVNPVSLAGTR